MTSDKGILPACRTLCSNDIDNALDDAVIGLVGRHESAPWEEEP